MTSLAWTMHKFPHVLLQILTKTTRNQRCAIERGEILIN